MQPDRVDEGTRSRTGHPPRFDALALQRVDHWCLQRGVTVVPVAMKALCLFLFSAAISPETRFEEGPSLGCRGLGIVAHPRARIGRNVHLGSSVTIGGTSHHYQVPIVKDDVYIGVGARILGPITLGRASVVAANAVVTIDVPPQSLVGGVPTKVLKRGRHVSRYA